MALWNPWHGCHKHSAGCQNCYVYRTDRKYGRPSDIVKRTAQFDLPMQKNRAGGYKLAGGDVVFTCFTSDFFVEDADEWRPAIWEMIRRRRDLHFFVITKRIERFSVGLPASWGDGYEHVTIASTCENQDRADYRLPILLEAPIKHKRIACEPLLGAIDLTRYLGPQIEHVIVGGESGEDARICDYDWVLRLRAQCARAGVAFTFKQTGAKFRKDGRLYHIARALQHVQASRAGIDTIGPLPNLLG